MASIDGQNRQGGSICHILMWAYKDDVPAAERSRLEAELETLAALVPELQWLEFGPVVGGRNHSFTHCFVMHFADMAGLQAYQVHPAHIHFAGPFREACAAQTVVDVQVPAA